MGDIRCGPAIEPRQEIEAMKRVLWLATALAGGIAASTGVRAQPVTGVYVGLGGGGNFMQQPKVATTTNFGGIVDSDAVRLGFDAGYVGLGSIGYGFGNGLRVEIEGDYRYNRLSSARMGSDKVAFSGHEQKYGAMANALFDMDIGLNWIYPYIGAGAGYQWVQLDPFLSSDKRFGTFAYQGILGASLPIPPVIGLSATLEYRFMGLAGISETTNAPGVKIVQKESGDYNHSVLVGLRYAFNVAPPPPPPAPAPAAAPAPAPARTYLVFFDWDRADLTVRARQVIADAARNATHVQVTRIEVDGYTDTSGTPQYNLGLSIRRAESVKAELIRDGVAANLIDIHGFGETHLLVPTGPGVREPQNRRVEIILR
jgi:outer membrane protein OmpA-like peptidoglycan-associated protein